MSGGSMDYLYRKVEDADFPTGTPERRALKDHLKLVAAALRSVEWVDSGDYGPGDENADILACIGKTAVLEAALRTAQEAHKALGERIEWAMRELEGDS